VVPGGTVGTGVPAISFVPGARPEHAASIRLETFDGPLALLLALIEQRRMDVLTVPLGDVAGAFLEAVAGLGAERLVHISAFIGVCSQLILIKSRALLPRAAAPATTRDDEGQDPEADLRRRLLLYRTYRDAGAALMARQGSGAASFHREAAAATASADAAVASGTPSEAPPLAPAILAAALARALRVVPPPPPPPEVMMRTVTLEERAAIIRGALRRAPRFVLQDLLHGVTDRVILAVTFLAMLELVKGHEVSVEQAEPWGPIVCRRLTPDAA
jgi:segregation and condensation protein A